MAENGVPDPVHQTEDEKQRLLIKSREELVTKFKEAFKVFAPMSTFLGFVGDIIKPLAPVLHYLAAFFGACAVLLVVLLIIGRRRGRPFKMTMYLPHTVILSVVLCFFSLIGYGSKDGFFGTNLDIVHKFQVNVMKVEPSTPPAAEKEEEKPENPEATMSAVDLATIDRRLDDLRELISLQKLESQPKDVKDYLVNAGIYYNIGNYTMAEDMMEKAVTRGYFKLDLCLRYYEVLFSNFNGDEQAIRQRLDSLGISGNEMMRLAAIDFNYSGIDYYRAVEKAGFKDPLLLAFAQNLKARSLINDSHNHWHYQPYLVARWIPVWNANDKVLGKNIIKVKNYFFDYPVAYRRYLAGTTEENRDNLIWRTDIHNASNDPFVQREAAVIWQRVVSGASFRAEKALNLEVSGSVTDESGKPLSDVVVTDMDTYTSGSTEYNMTVTDSSGTYLITTGRNHLLRFEPMFNKQQFRESFLNTGQEQLKTVILRRKR